MLNSDSNIADNQPSEKHIPHKWQTTGHRLKKQFSCLHCGTKKYTKKSMGYPVTYYDTGNEIHTKAPNCKRPAAKNQQLALALS